MERAKGFYRVREASGQIISVMVTACGDCYIFKKGGKMPRGWYPMFTPTGDWVQVQA